MTGFLDFFLAMSELSAERNFAFRGLQLQSRRLRETAMARVFRFPKGFNHRRTLFSRFSFSPPCFSVSLFWPK